MLNNIHNKHITNFIYNNSKILPNSETGQTKNLNESRSKIGPKRHTHKKQVDPEDIKNFKSITDYS